MENKKHYENSITGVIVGFRTVGVIPDDLVGLREAADAAGISKTYLNILARDGRITHYCRGLSSRRLYSLSEVVEQFGLVRRGGGEA